MAKKHPILSVPVATDEMSAIRSLMLLEGFDLMWHPDENAKNVISYNSLDNSPIASSEPLFPQKKEWKHANRVMDSIVEHLEDPYAVSNDLQTILNGGRE